LERLAIEGGQKAIPYALPHIKDASGRMIGDEELAEVTKVIRSGTLSQLHGTTVREFEAAFAERFGVGHAVATSSGTAALHCAIAAVNPNPGDEIVVSPITDLGSIAPILLQTAIPRFADVDPTTINVTPEAVERAITGRTKAMLVTHLTGHPADMDPIMELAHFYNLPVIEDCAQAHLAEYKGRLVGTIGDLGCFSFQHSKHMTTGDGGMVISNNRALAERMRLAHDKGWHRTPDASRMGTVLLATNYHMTALQAAVGIAQLRKLDTIVALRRKNAALLNALLSDIGGLCPPIPAAWAKHSYYTYPIFVDPGTLSAPLDTIYDALEAEGLFVFRHWGQVVYKVPMLARRITFGTSGFPLRDPVTGREMVYPPGLCPVAEGIPDRLILIWVNEKYTEEMVQDISHAFHKVFGRFAGRREPAEVARV
jgi:dTDP-4-amino-4,6-dideoxygalactose transaminase